MACVDIENTKLEPKALSVGNLGEDWADGKAVI